MIYHLARLSLSDEIIDSERDECFRRIVALRKLDAVHGISLCEDTEQSNEDLTHTLVISFLGEIEYNSYISSRIHKYVIDYLLPRTSNIISWNAREVTNTSLT